jgi:hypothetical protein
MDVPRVIKRSRSVLYRLKCFIDGSYMPFRRIVEEPVAAAFSVNCRRISTQRDPQKK